jgi:glycosyltransferase involved in cell wall biosynthesis
LIGDIGLRAFWQLYNGALKIIKEEQIDFIWLPIPSFYNAILGRILYEKSKIPYGIDYIDPWVRNITNQRNIKAIFSQWLARMLEPIALKKVSLISGVDTAYYQPALERNFPDFFDQNENLKTETINPYTNTKLVQVAMPYGFDKNDHKIDLNDATPPWGKEHNSKIWLYAGAFLPNSHLFLQTFFKVISILREAGGWDENIRLWFIGTGPYPSKRISSYAKDYGLQEIVEERRERFPYLNVLNWLSKADTVMIFGSTERHYTASKTFQALLSTRPLLTCFHYQSNVWNILEDCNASNFSVWYMPENTDLELETKFKKVLLQRLKETEWQPNIDRLEQYSAAHSAKKLVQTIEQLNPKAAIF